MKQNRAKRSLLLINVNYIQCAIWLTVMTVKFLCSMSSVYAQEPRPGSPAPRTIDIKSSFDKNLQSLARVNPSTLALEMSLPLMSYPGRNGNSLSVDFRYSSKVWRFHDATSWYTGQTVRRYFTDFYPLYAERSAGGWTSSLIPPRIDVEKIRYNYYGNPYGDNVIHSMFATSFQTAIYGGSSSGIDIMCSATFDEELGKCFYFNVSGNEPEPSQQSQWEQFYIQRLRVVMSDGSTKEFRKPDGQGPIPCGQYYPHGCPFNLDGTFLSVDGSGSWISRVASGYVLHLPDGSRYEFPNESAGGGDVYADSFTDVNGNRMTFFADNSDPQLRVQGSLTDTLGRQIVDPLPHNGYLQPAGIQPVNLPGIDGNPQQYQLTWQNLKPVGCEESTDTDPGCTGGGALENQAEKLFYSAPNHCKGPDFVVPNLVQSSSGEVLFPLDNDDGVRVCSEFAIVEDPNGIRTTVPVRFNPVVLSEVTLPNGQSYKFKYNRYGEITRITYPSGSYETFIHGVGPEPYAFGYNIFSQTVRGVRERKVYEADGTLVQKWTYTPESDAPCYCNIIINTEQSSPNNVAIPGAKTVARFHAERDRDGSFGFVDPRAGMPHDERTYDESGALRSRVLTEYLSNDVTPQYQTPYVARRDLRVKRKVSIMFEPGSANALATLSETTYDTTGSSEPSDFSHLNVKRQKSYEYISVPESIASSPTLSWDTIDNDLWFPSSKLAAVSEMDYSYDANYKARGIIGLPTESRLLNPQNQTEVLAWSQVEYDEQNKYYSMADYGATTGYVALTGANEHLRGNPTTKRTWNKDTNTWIETHTQFDNFGNVRKVWDTSGDQSRFLEYEYNPIYKYAYVTKTKAPGPDPSGVHGMTQGSEISNVFDFVTGLPLSVTDANGQTATTQYDSLLRPIRVIPPAGGAISETEYNDNERWVKSRQQIDGTNWAEKTVYFDSLGRPFKSKTKDAQSDVFSEIKYDKLGRVEKLSNPYRQGETIYWSKPRYDSVGRVVETFAPAPEGQTGASLGTVQFGISTENNLVGSYTIATDSSQRKSRVISGIYGIMRVDEATGIGGTVDQDLGPIGNPNQPTSYSYNIKGELIKITQGKAGVAGQPFQRRYFKYDSLGRLVRVRQPEQTPNPALATIDNSENNAWTAGFTYDVFGNVLTMTDAKNTTITNEYDKASRPVKRTYSDGTTPLTEYFYDGTGLPAVPQFSRGAITRVTNGVSEDRFTSFDNHGRLLTSEQRTDGQIYPFEYKYNLSGGLIEEKYPSGRTVKNTLNSDGGLNTVKTKAVGGLTRQVVSNIDYTASGDVRKMMLGNGLWETALITERNQLKQIGLGTTETNNSLFKVEYDYGELSEDGNSVDATKNTGMIARTTTTVPTSTTSTTNFVQTFKYDSINRLKEAKEKTGTQTNWQQTFGYDIFGNRTSFSQTVNGVQLPINNLTHPTIDQANNRFTTGEGYVYDFNGNLIQDAEGRSFTFDGDDKQTEVRNASNEVIGQYYYDASGARVKKVVPSTGEVTVFVYDAGGALAAEYSTIRETANPTTSYLTTDHLGSPRVITDQNKNVVSRRDFMPFGEEIGVGVGGRTAALKYSASGSDKIRKRYTGYEKDPETELDFAEARMYQNNHGRFTAVDPLMSSAKCVKSTNL